ncbi:MAG: DUF3604 domain-containing protein [Pseudomonadota bacterium]
METRHGDAGRRELRGRGPARVRSVALAGLLGASIAQGTPSVHPQELLWGDTHVHSNLSMDAHIYGNRHLGPGAAFRFAKGQAVTLADGTLVQLDRPLDFLVVADHAEYLGVRRGLAQEHPALLATEVGRRWHHHMTSPDGDPAVPLLEFAESLRLGKNLLADSGDFLRTVWEDAIEVAEAENDPGTFSTLLGYEWSSMPDGNNLHRVVVFRDGPDKVGRHLPFSALDDQRPEALWAALADYEQDTGGRALAIPHNPNLSGGRMFASTMADGRPMSAAYAQARARFETLVEVTQLKGDSETHPFLSPDDEFADFERWDRSNIAMVEDHRNEWFRGEYARAALLSGLALSRTLGVNPFEFGMIGSTDQHNALAWADEADFPGKFAMPGTGPDRWAFTVAPPTVLPKVYYEWELAAAGYAGVWVRENTREEVFDALARRETFATTGPRILFRFFAAPHFPEQLLSSQDWVTQAYAHGVPMGGVLTLEDDQSPQFAIVAQRDPEGATLDRVQVVKGWIACDGTAHERVHDVLLSDEKRRRGEEVSPVASTVDSGRAVYANNLGAGTLKGIWRDPDYRPSQHAFYYVRVLEIPTPRWTTYAAARHGRKGLPQSGVPDTLQERAYSSPIWVRPGG